MAKRAGGALALRILSERVEQSGAKILADTKVEALVREGSRIVGVKVRRFGIDSYLRGDRLANYRISGAGKWRLRTKS